MVGDGAIGIDLAGQVVKQGAEVADGQGAGAEAWKTLGGRGEDALGVGGAVEEREEVEDFARIETGAFDAQLVDGCLDVGQAAEVDADSGAARGGLRPHGQAQIFDGLAGFDKIGHEAVAVGVRLDFLQLAASHRAGDVSAEQFTQRFEFEDFGGCLQVPSILSGCEGRCRCGRKEGWISR